MSSSLFFELVSPEKLLVSEMIDRVILPAYEGEITVLAQHAPLATLLRPGFVTFFSDSSADSSTCFFVSEGWVHITSEKVALFVPTALPIASLNETFFVAEIAKIRKIFDEALDLKEKEELNDRIWDLENAKVSFHLHKKTLA